MAASYYNPPPARTSYATLPPPPPGTSSYGTYRQHEHAYLAAHPPPAYGGYFDRAEPLAPPRDELRTLFIAGLPADVKPREVYNLFRDFPGYVSSHVRSGKSTQSYAFAVFADQPSALAAMSVTNGLTFDLEKNCSIHVDLAKSNSRSNSSKRPRSDYEDFPKSTGKKARSPRGRPDSGAGSNIHMSGMGYSSHSLNGYPAQSYTDFGSSAAFSKDPAIFAPQNNPPCPTLFVANLGQTVSDRELNDVFSSCEGFIKLKMQNKFGSPVAFVDFKDDHSSTEALKRLQGAILHSSSGEGMRLEYAKSRMGLRKQRDSRS
ncbi:U2 small nuclear ribonucleoprotein B''-like [Triticum dicoccoides]|uniref:U2 small nuclear ribonucleoprotein B''-like n=1 Tax=Triticum dicoccoides TaxID=85692 RepID=UPI0018917E78|nr:U2 small nuclear ribonucleoprotein B''-like [Triticum dicoccoides]